mmetsp:Transcript_3505/g.7749  ORF Transcript_3505/g.7749 Transcript_3505/m.7749 type:complete len:626 (+) Transcript_3505:58-1935(+)|eukprot:CAMPEP_0171518612 /NCGR_PEP_ID=MMETSP0959-20130129/5379_1 /TAXON_ID=87120 /ORGANISM="Aurantiochytrium limacinum, Strain ATCCMYA-1381" /LENGTH=625 /DNA_ID=CAMNT_0012057833 /DNA_START=7 /DNA_END=1884 /DNA_ORIENTATION=+
MGNAGSQRGRGPVAAAPIPVSDAVDAAKWSPLEEVVLLQLGSCSREDGTIGNGILGASVPSDGDSDDDDDDDDDDRSAPRDLVDELFDGMGPTLCCEGQVVAGSRFKVVRTLPRGVLGLVEKGKTRIRVQCAFAIQHAPSIGRELRKVLLSPMQKMDGWQRADLTDGACFRAVKRVACTVQAQGGSLHLVAGQSIFDEESQTWFMVRACDPVEGGVVNAETAMHFDVESPVLTVENLRLLPVADTLPERLTLDPVQERPVSPASSVAGSSVSSLQSPRSGRRDDLGVQVARYLSSVGPVHVERGQSIWVPVFQQHVQGRVCRRNHVARGQAASREEIRQRRLDYFEGTARSTAEISEVVMMEWRVIDVQPSCGGVLARGSTVYTQGEPISREALVLDAPGSPDFVDDASQDSIEGHGEALSTSSHGTPWDEEEDSGSRCLRCGGIPEAPRGLPRCAIFCCPCGQPMPNPDCPLWISVERMLDDPRTSQRPSVVFLQELREVIAVMPMQDPRTPVLHSSLNVFPMTASGGVDFDQADRLVLLIMPSLRRPVRVDPRILERLPVTTFGAIREHALRRGESDCCICMEPYQVEDELRTLPCFHFMHKSCVDRWLSAARTCPICKYEVE